MNKLDDKKFTQSLTITLLLVTLIVPKSLHSSGTSGFEEALAIEYDKTQVTSEINECGNGQFPLSVLCQNSDSEDEMRVVERFTRQGNEILYELTVQDPVVLVEPFVMTPRIMRLNANENAGLLPERGNCDVAYEKDAIETQIRH